MWRNHKQGAIQLHCFGMGNKRGCQGGIRKSEEGWGRVETRKSGGKRKQDIETEGKASICGCSCSAVGGDCYKLRVSLIIIEMFYKLIFLIDVYKIMIGND